MYQLTNLSPAPQHRWAPIAVPREEALKIGPVGIYGQNGKGWYALRGDDVGINSTLYHVAAQLGGGATVSSGIEAAPHLQPPPFRLSSWIADDISEVLPRLSVVGSDGRMRTEDVWVRSVEQMAQGAAKRFWLVTRAGGIDLHLWATLWTWQDVIDLEGYVLWSRRSDPRFLLDVQAIDLLMGEEVHLDFATRKGFERIPGGWRLLGNSHLPDSMMLPFCGAVLPQPPEEANEVDPDAMDPQPGWGFDEGRLERVLAARGGPIVGAANRDAWDGRFLAFGHAPWLPVDADPVALALDAHSRFQGLLGLPGTPWDARPLANAKNTGQTGSQACFGAQKDAIAVSVGSPMRLHELQYSAEDYALRAWHYREDDGRILQAEDHPDCGTWSGRPHTAWPDTLGKPRTAPPRGWDHDRAFVDDQHRGGAYVWTTLAMTGSPVLQDVLRSFVQVDAMRAKGKLGSRDAPRACGRLLQDWAKMACVADDEADRDLLERMMRAEIRLWSPGGKTPLMSEAKSDPRVIDPTLAATMVVPWQDGLWTLGMMEARAYFQRVQDMMMVGEIEELVRPVVEWMVRFCNLDSETGELLAVNGMPAEEPEPGFLKFPSSWSGIPGPGITLLVGGGDWWYWHGAAYHAYLELFPDGAHRARAEEVARFLENPRNLTQAEWLSVAEGGGS